MTMKTWWSEHIINHHGYQRRVATEPFKYLATLYGEFDSVFDVGCGSAVWYENHKAFGKKGDYKGTDITEEFIIASKQEYPEVPWDVQDVKNLTEKDNSWDIVLGIHFLEYVEDYQKPISEMLRVAKKRVIIVMWQPIIDNGGVDGITSTPDKVYGNLQHYDRTNVINFLNTLPCKIVDENKEIADGRIPNFFWVLDKI